MFSYLLRRLLLLVPTLIGTTAVVFFVSALMPGGVAGSLLTADAQLGAINEFFDRLGERDARLSYAEGESEEQNEERALAA